MKSLSITIKKGKTYILLFLIPAFFLAGCRKENRSEGKNKGKIIAEVRGNYLYESDLVQLINKPLSKNDSVQMVKDFIDQWIKEQLVFQKALNNLTNEEKNKEKELQEYYKNLIIYEYENKLVRQNLDTIIDQDEIEQFYEKNRSQFILKKCLIRAVFLKVSKQAPDLDKVRKWYKSSRDEDIDLLHQYCVGHTSVFNIDPKKWYYFDELSSILPLGNYECESLKNNQAIEMSDSLNYYFISITEIKPRGTFMPIDFARDLIENTLLHQRKTELLKKARESIYQEGIRKKYFKIYE